MKKNKKNSLEPSSFFISFLANVILAKLTLHNRHDRLILPTYCQHNGPINPLETEYQLEGESQLESKFFFVSCRHFQLEMEKFPS